MARILSDSIFHPPSGSNYPGKEEANPYIFYPPDDIRRLLESEKDKDELKKMKSALKQWERLYVGPIGYPFKLTQSLRATAYKLMKLAEIEGPAQNLNYYQDAEVPEGYEGIIEEGLKNLHDNDYRKKFQIKPYVERTVRDFGEGDFLSPSEGIFNPETVKPRGDGPDPDGLEYPDPPTGGETGGL